jgi:hypothetical protein
MFAGYFIFGDDSDTRFVERRLMAEEARFAAFSWIWIRMKPVRRRAERALFKPSLGHFYAAPAIWICQMGSCWNTFLLSIFVIYF